MNNRIRNFWSRQDKKDILAKGGTHMTEAYTSEFRVLGLDPGSIKTGWGVISVKGSTIQCLGAGTARTKKGATLSERLLSITSEIDKVLDEAGYCDVAVEEVFVSKNIRSALILGHARGALLLTAAKRELPLYEYATAIVKRTIVGSGRADKTQVARVLQTMLSLSTLPGEDATDALAVALTHAQRKALDRQAIETKTRG